MNWFTGSIPDAIAEVKRCQKVLLVFVVGKNDSSEKMIMTYDNPAVANKLHIRNCVALKLFTTSIAYEQFSQIYPIVVVPSSFFIGKNGLPIEIITGPIETKDFLYKIDRIFHLHNISIRSSNTPVLGSFDQAEQNIELMDSSDCFVAETRVCSPNPHQSSTSKATAVMSPLSSGMAMKFEADPFELYGESNEYSHSLKMGTLNQTGQNIEPMESIDSFQAESQSCLGNIDMPSTSQNFSENGVKLEPNTTEADSSNDSLENGVQRAKAVIGANFQKIAFEEKKGNVSSKRSFSAFPVPGSCNKRRRLNDVEELAMILLFQENYPK